MDFPLVAIPFAIGFLLGMLVRRRLLLWALAAAWLALFLVQALVYGIHDFEIETPVFVMLWLLIGLVFPACGAAFGISVGERIWPPGKHAASGVLAGLSPGVARSGLSRRSGLSHT
ncbi:MAG: hypothetical protein E6G56_07590 [Actinobacteria bacterium]|nr:MAG: hypothetical protein E6G56_07590 [Actinomycetota bacterium]